MSTGLVEDRGARAMALRELRKVLASLRELAAALPPGVVTYPEAVPWNTPPHPAPAADMAALAEQMRSVPVVVPGHPPSWPYAGPAPALLQLFERLAHLLGLSDMEREFVTACASDEVLDAFDGRLAYADWLEERGDSAGALRVRKLTPRDGDLLVLRTPARAEPVPGEWDGYERLARDLHAGLLRRGVETTWVVLPPSAGLDALAEDDMAALGWVRAERKPLSLPEEAVKAEREACARVCDEAGRLAHPANVATAMIRARGEEPA